jgi:hypothetical protein
MSTPHTQPADGFPVVDDRRTQMGCSAWSTGSDLRRWYLAMRHLLRCGTSLKVPVLGLA